MAVVILIKRTVPEEKVGEVLPLFNQLRHWSLEQPGYVSGATLKRVDNPNEYLVISTWQLIEDWEKWKTSDKRKEIQGKIDSLIGTETDYEIYDYRIPARELIA
jgi:heme-degrading monooxygenase HmoA